MAGASNCYRVLKVVSLSAALLLLSCGCGPSVPARGSSGSMSSGFGSGIPTLNNRDIVYNGDGLHIEAQLSCRSMVVFATDRLSYDAEEVRAMRNFFVSRFSGISVPIPSTLVDASGGPCGAHIELTNIGSAAVVVDQVGLKLLANPRPNSYQYRRLNLCPFIGLANCNSGGTGGPDCTNYLAKIALGELGANSTDSDMPTPALQGCPRQLIVNPGPTAMLLDVELSGSSSIYTVALQLRLVTPAGIKTITFTEFPSVLIFARYEQYACYLVQGTTFALWAQGEQAFPIEGGPDNCS